MLHTGTQVLSTVVYGWQRLITFLLLPNWYTNFLFIHTNYIKLNSSTCFECNVIYGQQRLITFLLLPTWYTNFLFIHTNYIKLNSSTCFERNPLIIRRSTTKIVHMQPLVSSLSASDSWATAKKDSPSIAVAQDSHLQRVTIPEVAYEQSASLTSWWWADCARNM